MQAIRCDICENYSVREPERASRVVIVTQAVNLTLSISGELRIEKGACGEKAAGHMCDACEDSLVDSFERAVRRLTE